MAFVVSLLSGRAAQWATELWERDSRFNFSFDQFQAEMKKVFDHPVRGREAANRLISLRQGTRSVADYAVEFRILAADSSWDPLALQSTFSHGLGDNIKEYPAPSSISREATEEPMQAGRARLTAIERERRFRERLCLCCGQPGHTLSSCLNRPKDRAH